MRAPQAIGELPEVLQRSLKMRPPKYRPGASRYERIRSFEDYLLDSAVMQGDLTEERVRWMMHLTPLQDAWDHLSGWEHLKHIRTNEAIKHAKRNIRPDLYNEIEAVNWVIKRLTEEIDRMERDASKVSRAYTMETGST